MSDNGLTAGEQAQLFAISKIGNEVSHQLESWLSPWGNANVDLLVDKEGKFTGSKGSWFVPLQDNDRYLTWNQYSVTRREHDLVGNIGLGQRWRVGGWLLGYNSFYDKVLSESLARGSVGAEAWGEYLRLSANYYHPLGDWQLRDNQTREQRMAAGCDVTAQALTAVLPAHQHQHQRPNSISAIASICFTPAPATIIRWPSPLGSITPRSRAGHGDR